MLERYISNHIEAEITLALLSLYEKVAYIISKIDRLKAVTERDELFSDLILKVNMIDSDMGLLVFKLSSLGSGNPIDRASSITPDKKAEITEKIDELVKRVDDIEVEIKHKIEVLSEIFGFFSQIAIWKDKVHADLLINQIRGLSDKIMILPGRLSTILTELSLLVESVNSFKKARQIIDTKKKEKADEIRIELLDKLIRLYPAFSELVIKYVEYYAS